MLDREPPEEGLPIDESRPGIVEIAYDRVEAAKLRGEPAQDAARAIIIEVEEQARFLDQ